MNKSRVFPAFCAALVTALTIAGGIYITFYLIIDVLNLPATISTTPTRGFLFLLLLPLPFFTGGLWGAGISMLVGRPPWTTAIKLAWTWGSIQILATLLLDISQVPIFASLAVLGNIPHILHFLFTLVFVPAIGIVVFLNTRKLLKVMDLCEKREVVSFRSGTAAATAFLLTSMALLFGPGWEVAGPMAGQDYSMISIMHICNFAAALAGGWVIGWMVSGKSVNPTV